jgi:hypothetical protein
LTDGKGLEDVGELKELVFKDVGHNGNNLVNKAEVKGNSHEGGDCVDVNRVPKHHWGIAYCAEGTLSRPTARRLLQIHDAPIQGRTRDA